MAVIRKFRSEQAIKDLKLILASRLFDGVGKKSVEAMSSAFGNEIVKMLDTKPSELKIICGMGTKRISSIKSGWIKLLAVIELIHGSEHEQPKNGGDNEGGVDSAN